MSYIQVYDLINSLFYLLSIVIIFSFITLWIVWLLRLKEKDNDADKSKMSKEEKRRKRNQDIIDKYLK